MGNLNNTEMVQYILILFSYVSLGKTCPEKTFVPNWGSKHMQIAFDLQNEYARALNPFLKHKFLQDNTHLNSTQEKILQK